MVPINGVNKCYTHTHKLKPLKKENSKNTQTFNLFAVESRLSVELTEIMDIDNNLVSFKWISVVVTGFSFVCAALFFSLADSSIDPSYNFIIDF